MKKSKAAETIVRPPRPQEPLGKEEMLECHGGGFRGSGSVSGGIIHPTKAGPDEGIGSLPYKKQLK